jgi:hypothetical protein
MLLMGGAFAVESVTRLPRPLAAAEAVIARAVEKPSVAQGLRTPKSRPVPFRGSTEKKT